MPCEEPTRPLDVRVNLSVQLERRAELLLGPQKLMEVEPDHIAVNIRIEIKDVTLDRQRVILIERRPHADIRDALERAGEALQARSGHIDAAAGKELVRRIDVDSGESDLTSEPAPGDDAAVDEIRSSERERHCAHRSFVDRVSNDRARHTNAAAADIINPLDC